MGRGSPWRGSRDIHRRDSCAVVVKAWWPVRYRWGVVALGVVAEIWTSRTKREKGKNGNDINRAHKNPQPQFLLWKSFQHIYETHEIRRSMIFSTVSCLESDNDVSTSNTGGGRSRGQSNSQKTLGGAQTLFYLEFSERWSGCCVGGNRNPS